MAASRSSRPGRGSESSEDRTRRMAAERKRRQRNRQKAAKEGVEIPPDSVRRDPEVSRIIGRSREDIIKEVFSEELRPVVREAIDQDAVRAIQGMVGLVPAAILVLAQGLESKDELVRQRSASLIAKYTLGNPLAAPPRDAGGDKLVIINALPRPEPGPAPIEQAGDLPALDAESEELRQCDTCRLWKPLSEFPGDGPRCAQDLADKKESVINQFLSPEDRTKLLSENALPVTSSTENVQRESGTGQPEVHQAGPGLQPGDVRPSGLVENRNANPSGFEEGGPLPRPARVQEASQVFSGPPDPKRWQ